MISYRKGSPWQLIFRMTGSAIPRAAIPGAISACLSLIMDLSVRATFAPASITRLSPHL